MRNTHYAVRNASGIPMNLFSPPSLDDLIRLLRAWRFWVLGALVGALLSAAIFYIAPPAYRARATVNVDFNLEQAWPQETDRQQFYYLEREARKLEEIAWSDAVMQAVADADGQVTVNELRDDKLQLSQPAEAGWHFYADDADPQRAASLASVWVQAFAEQVRARIGQSEGLNSFIEVEITQVANLPIERSVSLSSYLLAGAVGFLFVSALLILFFAPPRRASTHETPG
jgi:capsular polysaccharide biosynthesis protein